MMTQGTKLFACWVALMLSATAAFSPSVRSSLSRGYSSSSLRMVADDAKVCLVTGSSRGLGKAIALDLGKAGQKVIINYVSEGSKESAQATVEEIKASGGDAVAIQADSKLNIYPRIRIQRSHVAPRIRRIRE